MFPRFNWNNRLFQTQVASIAVLFVANVFIFFAVITPAWQVAEDLDVGRYVQSGLWSYCQTGAQCWYIFSDNLINYYERVDVCRFLLIGDCRKKLLRTPYFFGWHYAVLILCLLSMATSTLAMVAAGAGLWKPLRLRLTTILYDILVFFSWLLVSIGLVVFMVNAEMLESKYLIGLKNTFEKTFGYSFYLGTLGAFVLTFAMMVAVMLTTLVFFTRGGNAAENAYLEKEAMRAEQQQRSVHYAASTASKTMRPLHVATMEDSYSLAPSSILPTLSPGQHGTLIAHGDRGSFSPTTRHFYSY